MNTVTGTDPALAIAEAEFDAAVERLIGSTRHRLYVFADDRRGTACQAIALAAFLGELSEYPEQSDDLELVRIAGKGLFKGAKVNSVSSLLEKASASAESAGSLKAMFLNAVQANTAATAHTGTLDEKCQTVQGSKLPRQEIQLAARQLGLPEIPLVPLAGMANLLWELNELSYTEEETHQLLDDLVYAASSKFQDEVLEAGPAAQIDFLLRTTTLHRIEEALAV